MSDGAGSERSERPYTRRILHLRDEPDSKACAGVFEGSLGKKEEEAEMNNEE
jgi:hypothetical protein